MANMGYASLIFDFLVIFALSYLKFGLMSLWAYIDYFFGYAYGFFCSDLTFFFSSSLAMAVVMD